MQVTSSNYPIADYCRQLTNREIIVNRDYQRSDKVWPQQARSYLIETLLLGYPIPKLSLYIKTDVKSRTTRKEIVDGQQRSTAIFAYFNDEFAISTSSRSRFAGKKLSQLDEADIASFIDYQLSVDIFTAATDFDIREVFRRMNSYTVPLNPSEQRYATHQGVFKWFIANLTSKYSQTLINLKIFSERTLVRMNDATLFTEIIMSINEGIFSSNDSKITKFYGSNEKEFPRANEYENRIDEIFQHLINWEELRSTSLMKPYNFYSLALAITHHLAPVESLQELYHIGEPTQFDRGSIIRNLSFLASIQEDGTYIDPEYSSFLGACSAGTNRINQRETRFKFYCYALNPHTSFQ